MQYMLTEMVYAKGYIRRYDDLVTEPGLKDIELQGHVLQGHYLNGFIYFKDHKSLDFMKNKLGIDNVSKAKLAMSV